MTAALAPPASPSPSQPRSWRCVTCGGKLGQVHGERVTIRIGRRQIEARLPVSQVCDRCGAFNTLSKEERDGF